MKHINLFENWKSEERLNEGLGLALLVGLVSTLAAPAAYNWARNFWSSKVVGSKYKETGKSEKVITKLPKDISNVALLSKQQRDSGEVVTELKEYTDNLGNIFWGYDHVWSPDSFGDFYEYLQHANYYTALYKEEDLGKLKKFLENSQRYAGKSVSGVPTPIEMIYRKEGPRDSGA